MGDLTNGSNAPKATWVDKAYNVTKALVSEFPGGGTLAEFVGSYIQPPLAKRQQEWLESVIVSLKELEQHYADFNAENAFENPTFFTTFLNASQLAARTHLKEKLASLRNMVLNSVLPGAPDDDTQLMFMNFVEDFGLWHLTLLRYFVNPRDYGEQIGILYPKLPSETGDPSTPFLDGPHAVLEFTFPELNNSPDFRRQLVADLQARGLIAAGIYTAMVSMNDWVERLHPYDSYITELGEQFLTFLTAPDWDKGKDI